MMCMNEEDILTIIRNDTAMMAILRAAESLQLPDWMIGAGFVRSKIWDYLHGKVYEGVQINDIDLVYFDPENTEEEIEKAYDMKLRGLFNAEWSTKNVARMSQVDGVPQYTATKDAIAVWPETATALAVALDGDNLRLIAPCGIEDLVNMTVRMNPKFPNGIKRVRERVEQKGWRKRWPKLTFEL